MPFPKQLTEAIKMAVFVTIGAIGSTLFTRSLPPPEGTAQHEVFVLSGKLKASEKRIKALEDMNPDGSRKSFDSGDAAKLLARRIASGETISVDDIWKATRPMMRDVFPLMNRLRLKDEKRRIDWRVGELTRKYNLDANQQATLKKLLLNQSEENAKLFQAELDNEASTMLTMNKLSRELRPDSNLDKNIEQVLQGENLKQYKQERLQQKAEAVQRDADYRMERMNQIVTLDENQKDQVFAIMARGSRDYDPTMKLEGIGTDSGSITSGADRTAALRAVLRPGQQFQLDEYMNTRRAEAEKDMAELNMTLPEDWDAIEYHEMGWSD